MNLTVGERVENGAKLLDDYASDWFNHAVSVVNA